MKRIAIVLGIGLVMCGWGLAAAQGAVQVSPLFSDHMVLQRGMQTPIWGKASPGEKIIVELAKQSAGAAADEKGDWLVKLPAMKVGDATTLTITGTDGKPITIKDVVIGDVWDASGQSNMDWQVKQSAKAQEEIKSANHPNIRFFRFPKSSRVEPTKEIKPEGKWEVCTPQTVGEFSGVAYFFAREISGSENVPVGIIQNAWGGMPAEAFTSEQTLLADPELAAHVEKKRKAVKETDAKEKYEKELAAWQDKNYVKDPGNKGVEKGWAKSEFDDGAWKTMKLPAKWEPATGQRIDGALWFRRSVEIPGEWEGRM
jgi:sialate O-acetylesterase